MGDLRMAVLGHVGDSRCYLSRSGSLYQLSEDHSLVGQQMRAGVITEDAARTHPYRNVITRSLGSTADVEVDLYAFEVQDGDRLLLCSDGLSGSLRGDEIHELLEKNAAHRCPEILVDAAIGNGATDNVTAVVMEIPRQ